MNKWSPFRSRKKVSILLVLSLLAGFSLSTWGAENAQAAEYDPQDAGNPLRIAGYLLFPVGVLAEYCLMRPAFWIVQKEPFSTLFGYEYIGQVGEEVKQDPVEERLETSEHR